MQCFIRKHGQYRQGQIIANRYNKDRAENNPRASVGRRSAYSIQRARQRDSPR